MKPKHWLVFLLLGAIWSSSFMWIKIAVQEIGPVTLVAFRTLFGLLFGIVVISIQRLSWPRSRREWITLLVLGIANIAIPFFLISWGEQTIDHAVDIEVTAVRPLSEQRHAVRVNRSGEAGEVLHRAVRMERRVHGRQLAAHAVPDN